MPRLGRTLPLLATILLFGFGSMVTAKAAPFTLTNGQSVTVNYVANVAGNSAQAIFTYNQIAGTVTVQLTNTSTNALSKLTRFGFSTSTDQNGTATSMATWQA